MGDLNNTCSGNLAQPTDAIRLIESMDQLDEICRELDAAAAISDDELRNKFKSFAMQYPVDFPSDPYSEEYRKKQFQLYARLHGKPYHLNNEVSSFVVERAIDRPFPFYTESPQTVGNQLIAIGYLIRTLDLPAKSSILEFGPGWGNTTIWLARMGYSMTCVDIEQRFVDLISERARRKNLHVEAIQGDFLSVCKFMRQWDAVVFFECFHHCADHHALIASLHRVVAPGGKLVFAAEPIFEDFPVPWGFRLDGESLWAIRKFGWCELGFKESYFTDLLGRYGWQVRKNVCTETPWGTIFVATHN